MSVFNLKLRVRLKEGILDPEAQAIESALHRLGFSGLRRLQQEKTFLLEIEADSEGSAKEQARKMANDLLANLVMEDFEIE